MPTQSEIKQEKNSKLLPRTAWNIHQKIGYGYFVAIGIGFLGTILGMFIADYYQGQSIEKFWDAQEQSQLLQDFERSTEAFQLRAVRLALLTHRPRQFKLEYEDLQSDVEMILLQQKRIEEFLDGSPTWLAAKPDAFRSLIQTYTHQIQEQSRAIAILLNSQSSTAQSLNQSVLPDQLQNLVVGANASQFDRLHQQLIDFSRVARSQEQQAGDEMENAQGLEKLLLVLSMLLASGMAGTIAWRTTRAIAHPIEQITQVAEQAALESNFDLRVSVATQDEVGSLAQSLNLLIQRVSERTQALQESAAESETQAQVLQKTLETLRKTQIQLVQTEKMSSLGRMVAGIAHEINNPVSFIYGNLDYAKSYVSQLLELIHLYQELCPKYPQIQEYQQEIDFQFLQEDLPKLLTSLGVGTERLRSIILSLRIFARLDESEIKLVNLHDGIDSTLVILSSRLKAQILRAKGIEFHRPEIHIVKQYGEIPLIECYAGHLNQVFMNILANAIDALEENFESSVLSAQSQESSQFSVLSSQLEESSQDSLTQNLTTPTITIHTTTQEHQWVVVRISDNGPGIPEAIQAKIFDPFFTTKAVGKGTGLGMSISYEVVVEKHHGELSLTSSPGEGATFTIKLPIVLKSRTSDNSA